jgi:hypothetical protein
MKNDGENHVQYKSYLEAITLALSASMLAASQKGTFWALLGII